MNLVFHHGALGDVVLTFPLLATLDEPTLFVTHASKSRLAARLFSHVGPADIESPPWARLFASAADVILPEATRVISFLSDGTDTWAANVRRLLPKAAHYFVRPRPPADWPGHVTAWHRHQLASQGWVMREPTLTRKRSTSRGEVVIHTGSGGREKCWPPERFAELVRHLRCDVAVRVIAGEAEADRGLAGDAQVLPTLDALYDTLAHASLFIGNDSGPTHLAAWVGVPTIALFGPTNPRTWSPVGPTVAVVSPPLPRPMAWLDVQTVLATVRSFP